ncbi:MAG TPA: transporter, partial [Verrucomicrobiae bacterium]|nr:transporter [Verrucomicrobiae bacterium]
MISRYDYLIIGFYLVFLIAIGLVFRRMSKNTSDYFRAGGAMPWWITGTSAWIFSFTAWTFTGAAGKVYETGPLVLIVFYSTIVALCFVIAFTCLRFRRMRVITWMEGVRLRYGPFSEQFYTWIKLPLLLLFASVPLNAIAVFMSSVFHVDMTKMIVVLGVVVTLVAFAGGSWAVLASDFVQAFLIVTITFCTAIMVLHRPEIGGLSGLIAKVPHAHFHWGDLASPGIIFAWAITNLWLKFSDENNMERSTMYLMTRSDRDARRMVLIPLIGTLIGPLIWFIPPMAATILHPHLAAEYPTLKQPHEAAFVAVAMDVMPQGLLGLLLSAMLGATVTSMDAGLNKNVGIAIRSLYKPVFRPDASEKHLLVAGKICTLLFGAIIILLALYINDIRTTNLFDFANQLA